MNENELLDHFAGLAMQALVADEGAFLREIEGDEIAVADHATSIAIDAYAIASAMIDQRRLLHKEAKQAAAPRDGLYGSPGH